MSKGVIADKIVFLIKHLSLRVWGWSSFEIGNENFNPWQSNKARQKETNCDDQTGDCLIELVSMKRRGRGGRQTRKELPNAWLPLKVSIRLLLLASLAGHLIELPLMKERFSALSPRSSLPRRFCSKTDFQRLVGKFFSSFLWIFSSHKLCDVHTVRLGSDFEETGSKT